MRKLIFVGCLLLFQHAALRADGEKEILVKESLKDIRNPRVLDSLAEGLLAFTEDSVALGRAYFLKGMARSYAGNPQAAANYFTKSLSYLEPGVKYDERFNYGVVLKNQGIAHYRSRNYSEGDSSFLRLQSLALEDGDSLAYSSALKAMANALMVQRSYDSAAKLMTEVALLQQRLKYPGISSTYLSLGSIFGRMKLEEDAMKWFRLALKAGGQDQRLESRVYNNLAVAQRALGAFDSANFYQYRALSIQKSLALPIDQVESHANLARNYLKLNIWDSVNFHVKHAYSLLPPGRSGGLTRHNLWLLSLRLSIHRQDLVSASSYFDSIRAHLPQEQMLRDPEYLDAMAAFYDLAAQSDSAYHYMALSKKRLTELNEERDAARIKANSNEVELAALKEEQRGLLKGYQLALLVLAVFVISGGAWLWYASRRVKRIKLDSEETQFGEKDSEEPSFELVNHRKRDLVETVKPELVDSLKLKSKAIIKITELKYLQSDGHYLNLFLTTQPNPEVERSSLKTWEEKLMDQDNFIRIHRSYIINLSELKAVYAAKVLLKDGTELPVSRTYKEDLQKRFSGQS